MHRFAVSALAEPPFPARINAESAQAARGSADWAVAFELVTTEDGIRRLGQANAAELAGRACPDADPDLLRLLTDLVTWLFAFDDACDEDGLGADPTRLAPTIAGLLGVLDLLGTPAPDRRMADAGPVGTALHDLCRRVRAHARPALLLRFVGQFRDYLLALLWEAANRERQRVPGVAEYIQMRRHTGAVHPSFTLTDLAHDGHLDPARCNAAALVAIDTLAADLVCWCNDVFSYARERQLVPGGHSLPSAIARETGRDERQALLDTAERFNHGLTTYLRMEADLLADPDPGVARFTAARRCWIRATYDWSMHAARYS